MTIRFNLKQAVHAAEAGDVALWQDIAKHLLAQKSKPKARRANKSAPMTWAHVTLQDGREFLTSHYAESCEHATMQAHGASAQYRARMEDSGDRGGTVRAYLDSSVKPVPVARVTMLHERELIESIRERCFTQRGIRHGWLKVHTRKAA